MPTRQKSPLDSTPNWASNEHRPKVARRPILGIPAPPIIGAELPPDPHLIRTPFRFSSHAQVFRGILDLRWDRFACLPEKRRRQEGDMISTSSVLRILFPTSLETRDSIFLHRSVPQKSELGESPVVSLKHRSDAGIHSSEKKTGLGHSSPGRAPGRDKSTWVAGIRQSFSSMGMYRKFVVVVKRVSI